MSLGALWNVWSHNFSNMFITPLSMPEYVWRRCCRRRSRRWCCCAGARRSPPSLFDFNLFSMGLGNLGLLFLNLLWFAYSIGLFILGIILRLGTRIQALAWGLVLIFQPLTAAFYPLSVMPPRDAGGRACCFRRRTCSKPRAPALSTPDGPLGLDRPSPPSRTSSTSRWRCGSSTYMYRRSRETGQFARNEE